MNVAVFQSARSAFTGVCGTGREGRRRGERQRSGYSRTIEELITTSFTFTMRHYRIIKLDWILSLSLFKALEAQSGHIDASLGSLRYSYESGENFLSGCQKKYTIIQCMEIINGPSFFNLMDFIRKWSKNRINKLRQPTGAAGVSWFA